MPLPAPQTILHCLPCCEIHTDVFYSSQRKISIRFSHKYKSRKLQISPDQYINLLSPITCRQTPRSTFMSWFDFYNKLRKTGSESSAKTGDKLLVQRMHEKGAGITNLSGCTPCRTFQLTPADRLKQFFSSKPKTKLNLNI